jgi:DNA-binding transcriptional LysR family regulator
MDLMGHDLIGSDRDTAILDGFRASGYPVSKDLFAFRTDDLIVQWEAVRAGMGIGFVPSYMARSDVDVMQVLPDVLRIPPLPMWLAVHREIRTSRLIRTVYDFLASALPDAI